MRLREQVKPYLLALHLTLGLVILFESARELLHAATRAGHGHLAVVATIEGIAAILFLWPRTMRLGGLVLTAVLAGALIVHAVRGEFLAPLLVYAVATLFVTVNGNAWRNRVGEL